MGMADVWQASAPETGAVPVGALFRARYPELVRLADLLGADDPEDIAQEAFARLIQPHPALRSRGAQFSSFGLRRSPLPHVFQGVAPGDRGRYHAYTNRLVKGGS